jgi:hypothetical protein
MPRKMGIVVCCAASFLAIGCTGSAHRMQIVPTGRGTFMIPSQDLLGAASSSTERAKANEEAVAYCAKLGMGFEALATSDTEGGFREIAPPDIEFRCLAPAVR